VLRPLFDAKEAMQADAALIRDGQGSQTDNHTSSTGIRRQAKNDEVFANAEVVVSQDISTGRATRRRWRPADRSPNGPIAASSRCGQTPGRPHANRTRLRH